MNKEIKARWIAALRDPKAKQTTGKLGEVDGGRCCLGVLCDIAVADGVIAPPIPYGRELKYAGSYHALPDEVITWAGLNELHYSEAANPRVQDSHLADWNDNYEKTFPEIADMIEGSDL